ncbi:CRISPR-associated protein, TIGR02710 family [Thermobacillus composti KWC4]|uniref:CRISPR-associated protein, TIGR02710 family n=1 Tax=Thermobacillus composti (strain DSM 18247 / JCM 13945 / KWC4) TaxID=717605 RepID=L0EFX6_THECK|nr:TIGR02710 family CRISPR-associated CARF protein [Thermobacillus composti]AGA59178.1 CRISPR-associated protein, TIGR02710 family [Thermobacillus composti KWC4]
MKVLIMTVGGDDTPLVLSIKELKPDYIHFICSSGQNSSRVMVIGDGKVCGKEKDRPNILIQAGFPKDQTTIVEVDPDDPAEVYELAKEIIAGYKGHQVYTDYTGGTKSMASGLLVAALEYDYCQPILMKGPRADLNKVTGDRSRVFMINRHSIIFSRFKKTFEDVLNRQDYGGARDIVRTISKIGADKNDEEFLDRANVVMNAFDLWDRFEYGRAWEDLDYFSRSYRPNQQIIQCKIMAGRLAGIVEWLKIGSEAAKQPSKTESTPNIPHTVSAPWREAPLPVYDLIRNAERRARMEQYDDAVARLYRATELYAQFALRRRDISTSNITEETLTQLSEERRERLELKRDAEGRLAIGLFESYELLSGLNEPIGQVWEAHKARIKDAIKYRNLSWLAHGFEPVTRQYYETFHEVLTEFINQCDEADPHFRKNKVNLNNYPDLPNTVCFMD